MMGTVFTASDASRPELYGIHICIKYVDLRGSDLSRPLNPINSDSRISVLIVPSPPERSGAGLGRGLAWRIQTTYTRER